MFNKISDMISGLLFGEQREAGQHLAEYALIIALVAIAVITALVLIAVS